MGQARFGRLLATGTGVEKDLIEAAKWRALARKQGLDDKLLGEMLLGLSDADLQEAEERANNWPNNPLLD